jgi:hypothetical protein
MPHFSLHHSNPIHNNLQSPCSLHFLAFSPSPEQLPIHKPVLLLKSTHHHYKPAAHPSTIYLTTMNHQLTHQYPICPNITIAVPLLSAPYLFPSITCKHKKFTSPETTNHPNPQFNSRSRHLQVQFATTIEPANKPFTNPPSQQLHQFTSPAISQESQQHHHFTVKPSRLTRLHHRSTCCRASRRESHQTRARDLLLPAATTTHHRRI